MQPTVQIMADFSFDNCVVKLREINAEISHVIVASVMRSARAVLTKQRKERIVDTAQSPRCLEDRQKRARHVTEQRAKGRKRKGGREGESDRSFDWQHEQHVADGKNLTASTVWRCVV